MVDDNIIAECSSLVGSASDKSSHDRSRLADPGSMKGVAPSWVHGQLGQRRGFEKGEVADWIKVSHSADRELP